MTEDSDSAPVASEAEGSKPTKARRGKGTGSNFLVLDRDVWELLWKVETTNRLNLVTIFLVLLAGTGADHRLTKWSAKACEERTGMGKPRGKLAITELVASGLVEHTASSSRMRPQYRLREPTSEKDPIFLPGQLISGFDRETPILRRVRETGDALLLRMLIDLYGLIQLDPTHGLPLASLRQFGEEPARKVAEVGIYSIWALELGDQWQGVGDWRAFQSSHASPHEFWDRVRLLKKLGGVWFEPWVFEGDALDSEPLLPVALDPYSQSEGEAEELTSLAGDAARALVEDRSYLLDRYSDRVLIPLPTHRPGPTLVGVGRLRVEADTPGRRVSYALRKSLVERWRERFTTLISDAESGYFGRPS